MTERKYSVSEIDRMRAAVRQMTPFHSGERKPAEIEDRLRTYMANGTDPDELEAAAKEYAEREWKRWLEAEEMNRKFQEMRKERK